MELTIKGNINYCASIVSIKNIIDLEGCNNIKGTTIFGNHVIVSKDVKIGDLGVYFPVETRISDEFLSYNNLFDKPELNRDKTKKGFFSTKGRVRAVKLRGFVSDGFWIPIQSFLGRINQREIDPFKEGDSFDHINGNKICEKYFVPCHNGIGNNTKRNEKKSKKRFSKVIDTQFRFHIDTQLLGRNLDKLKPYALYDISQKLHGSSFIVSNLLCKRKLTLKDKIAKKLGVSIKETEYDSLYASRKVIKNAGLCKNQSGYYSEDIWGKVNEELKPFLQQGMTIYGEVVGYLSNGRMIQKNYDYGCKVGEHKNFIYRITTTLEDGHVIEWPMLHVREWCNQNGLNAVPLLYYGSIKNWFICNGLDDLEYIDLVDNSDWKNIFMERLTEVYLEKDCILGIVPVGCISKMPDEGIVIRNDSSLDIEVFKHKSFNFKCAESKQLDSGETNIEDNQEV